MFKLINDSAARGEVVFDGQDVLSLQGDHLDISYRVEGSWPSMRPAGSIKNYSLAIRKPDRWSTWGS